MSLKKNVHHRPAGSTTQGHVDFGVAGTTLTLCWLSPEPPTNCFQHDDAELALWDPKDPWPGRGRARNKLGSVWLSSLCHPKGSGVQGVGCKSLNCMDM